MIDRQPPRWRTPGICLALAAMTFAVFGQTLRHEFVDYDDNLYVYGNPVVAQGLSMKGVAWVFTHADCQLYHPLTMLSLMGDYQLHGLHAGWYHFTNVLLHALSSILLFLVLRQMTGAAWRSAFVAAVFAIHPLRVESVAWVSERKDVLSAFFFMLTLGAYARYIRKPNSPARYLMVAAAFVPALLSKPTVVTLPFVLLFLDYWPLNRFGQPRKLLELILEKISLLALAAGAGAMTLLATKEALTLHAHVSMGSRIGVALVSYVIYLRQMIWPEGLAVLYPYPENGYPFWAAALSFLLLALITGSVLALRRKQPWMLTGWLWYLGMLAPVIGIVQVGVFAHADRYTYLPQIGIYMAVTWMVAEWRMSRVVLGGLMAGALAALMVCACKQTVYWQNSEDLWTHALACTTGNYIAHNDLGNDVCEKGRMDEGITHFQQALQIKPDYAEANNNLANALLQERRVDEAIAQYRHTLQIDPNYAEAHHNLGVALYQKGRMDEAIAQYQQALRIKPDYADAHNNLGNALLRSGRVDEAITQYRQALQINPALAAARNNLERILPQKQSP